ncbi:MAG: hypothetical protein WCH57_08770 [Verrucomicrobiota bacterium]
MTKAKSSAPITSNAKLEEQQRVRILKQGELRAARTLLESAGWFCVSPYDDDGKLATRLESAGWFCVSPYDNDRNSKKGCFSRRAFCEALGITSKHLWACLKHRDCPKIETVRTQKGYLQFLKPTKPFALFVLRNKRKQGIR